MKKATLLLNLILATAALTSCADNHPWTNPIDEGWYADPEGIVFGDELWIYPTYSHKYEDQLHLDAFSTKDLKTWTKHENIISNEQLSWLHMALWAPAVTENNGKYYIFFACNDVHEGEIGGIGVGVADSPAGPFQDLLGSPLIGNIVNGAQPIDQFVWHEETNDQWYMYYGGWGHCNIVRLSPDFTSLIPFDDGDMYKEITPLNYVEGPFMFKKNGKYYFMWSEGGWTGADYHVAYAISDSPFGPFERVGTILEQDPEVGTGAGHHSIVCLKQGRRCLRAGDWDKDDCYIIYHRHPLGSTDGNCRVTCVDRMYFNADGTIKPVKMTF